MEGRRLVAVVFAGLAVVLFVVLWLLPKVDERLRPQPRAAWIGIEVDNSGVAVVGRVELSSDQDYRIHAILEAETQGGDKVYFTEAQSIDFGEGPVVEGVVPWNGSETARILWLTLEGPVPYLLLPKDKSLDGFRFEEFLHPEWGRGWTANASLDSNNDDQLLSEDAPVRAFGTQHYRAWIELFESDKAIVPAARYKSPGFELLATEPERFATVTVELEAARAAPSRVFGLTQIELAEGADPAELDKLTTLFARGLAFSRLLVLRSTLERAGTTLDDLEWQLVDLSAGRAWGPSSVQPGDLLRVGARWVILFEDAHNTGKVGKLDPEDLCIDFDRGTEIRPLNDIFVGGGDIEWASLAASR